MRLEAHQPRADWLSQLGQGVVKVMQANGAEEFIDFFPRLMLSGSEEDVFVEFGRLKKFRDTKLELLLGTADLWGRTDPYHTPNAVPDLFFNFVTKRRTVIRNLASTSNLFFPPFQTEWRDDVPMLDVGKSGQSNSFGVRASYVPIVTEKPRDFLIMDIAFFFYIIGRGVTVPTHLKLRRYGESNPSNPIVPPSRTSVFSLIACPECQREVFAWAKECEFCGWRVSTGSLRPEPSLYDHVPSDT